MSSIVEPTSSGGFKIDPAESYRVGLWMVGITALTWSILPFFIQRAFESLSLAQIAWFRFLFSALGVAAWISYKGISFRQTTRRFWILSLLAGVLLAINYQGFMSGIYLASPSQAQVLIQIGPALLALWGVFVWKESIRTIQGFGLAAIALGMVGFYWEQSQGIGHRNYLWGNLWILIAALTWVGYALIQKYLAKTYDPQLINFGIYLSGALCFSAGGDVSAWPKVSGELWAVLVFLGMNTLLAYGALGEALQRLPSYWVSAVIVCNPLITLLFVYLLQRGSWVSYAGRAPSLWALVGAVVMISGTVLVVAGPGLVRYFKRFKKIS